MKIRCVKGESAKKHIQTMQKLTDKCTNMSILLHDCFNYFIWKNNYYTKVNSIIFFSCHIQIKVTLLISENEKKVAEHSVWIGITMP